MRKVLTLITFFKKSNVKIASPFYFLSILICLSRGRSESSSCLDEDEDEDVFENTDDGDEVALMLRKWRENPELITPKETKE